MFEILLIGIFVILGIALIGYITISIIYLYLQKRYPKQDLNSDKLKDILNKILVIEKRMSTLELTVGFRADRGDLE